CLILMRRSTLTAFRHDRPWSGGNRPTASLLSETRRPPLWPTVCSWRSALDWDVTCSPGWRGMLGFVLGGMNDRRDVPRYCCSRRARRRGGCRLVDRVWSNRRISSCVAALSSRPARGGPQEGDLGAVCGLAAPRSRIRVSRRRDPFGDFTHMDRHWPAGSDCGHPDLLELLSRAGHRWVPRRDESQ